MNGVKTLSAPVLFLWHERGVKAVPLRGVFIDWGVKREEIFPVPSKADAPQRGETRPWCAGCAGCAKWSGWEPMRVLLGAGHWEDGKWCSWRLRLRLLLQNVLQTPKTLLLPPVPVYNTYAWETAVGKVVSCNRQVLVYFTFGKNGYTVNNATGKI